MLGPGPLRLDQLHRSTRELVGCRRRFTPDDINFRSRTSPLKILFASARLTSSPTASAIGDFWLAVPAAVPGRFGIFDSADNHF